MVYRSHASHIPGVVVGNSFLVEDLKEGHSCFRSSVVDQMEAHSYLEGLVEGSSLVEAERWVYCSGVVLET